MENKFIIPTSVKNDIINFYGTQIFNTVKDTFEKTGKVPEGWTGLQKYESKLIPNTIEGKTKYLKTQEDESNLTDEELQQKSDIYNELKNDPSKKLDIQAVLNKISEFLSANANFGYTPSKISDVLDRAKGQLKQGTLHPFEGGKYYPDLEEHIFSVLGRQIAEGAYRKNAVEEDVSGDISRVNNLLSTRKNLATKNKEIEDYLSQLPVDLKSSRESFFDVNKENALNEFNESIPSILANQNRRGMLFSGDVQDELSTKALSLESGLENTRLLAEAEDNQFYFDAAYRDAIRKSLAASTDYQSALESERNKILTERENRFRAYQSSLDENLNTILQRNDAERSLTLRKSQLQAQKDAANKAKTGELIGTGANLITSAIVAGSSNVSGATTPAKTAPVYVAPESI